MFGDDRNPESSVYKNDPNYFWDRFKKKWMNDDDYLEQYEEDYKKDNRYGNLEEKFEELEGKFKGALEESRRTGKKEREEFRKARERYERAQRGFARRERGRIEEDRAYWNRMRDQAYGDWRTDRDSMLDFWTGVRDEETDFLRGLKKQQIGLADELRNAPSTVMEQARMMQDRALSENIALAGAMGGGVSSNYANLENRARSVQGDLLTATSALRADEYASRIRQRSGILGQAGNISGMITGLGAGDAELRSGLAAQNYNILTGLGMQNVNVGTALQGRGQSLLDKEQGFLGNIVAGSNMSRLNDMSYMGGISQLQGMRSGLLRDKILMDQNRRAEEQYQQSLRDNLWKKIIGGLATGASIVAAPFTGGASLAGLPAGLSMLGGGGGGGGGQQQIGQGFGGLFNRPQQPSFGSPNPDNWDFRDVGGRNIGSDFY